jgi:hypothetical protein
VIARFFNGVGIFRHLLRAFAPTLLATAPVLALRAIGGRESSLSAAIGMLALYIALTISATVVLERPLLSEALGYLVRRRPQPAS